ncbi:MAG: hypothetical protein ACE14W_12330 [Candidatus Velamenicoccus archaeovorus]
MAIKGKSKPKARRAVTPGPRPAYVPVKRRWYARREVQVGVAVVLLVAATAGVWYGIDRSRSQAHEREQLRLEKTAATAYQAQVNQALSGVGQTLPPSGFVVAPGLSGAIDGLRKGSVEPAAAAKDAETALTGLKAAVQALDGIDATSLVSGKGIDDQVFVQDVINSRSRMSQAMHLYRTAAQLLADAAAASGEARDALLDRASSVLDVAQELFADGYTDYVNAQGIAQVFQPTLPSAGSPLGGS